MCIRDSYYGHCGSLDMPPYVWVDTGKITAEPKREEGVTRSQDQYGWYRKGPISDDFKIEQVLPHLFNKSFEYIKSHSSQTVKTKPFFMYLALPAPHTPIVPVPPFKGASGLNPYADFVMQIDHHMGELFKVLLDEGIDKKTLVGFTSDNGCSPEANFKLLKDKGHDPSGGFRGHKADIYEGGHRVPLLVRWPDHIDFGNKEKDGGAMCDSTVSLTDIYKTLEEISGQKNKTKGGEDGFSIVPLLKGEQRNGRESIISHSIGGSFAIREGDWKLCLSRGSGGWSPPRESEAKKRGLPDMQLFNLQNDPGEKNNLVSTNPEKVTSLLKLLESQVERGRSTPGPNLSIDRIVLFLP